MAADVMVDIETTGISAGCCILSIGAVTFDLRHSFYTKIEHRDSRFAGLQDDPAAIAWWNSQSKEARNEAFSGSHLLVDALGQFADYLQRVDKDVYLWGNGADFDLPILEAAYNIMDMKKPWGKSNGRCYRTLKNLYFNVKPDPMEAGGIKHNALHDAIFQARHAKKILSLHFNKEKKE